MAGSLTRAPKSVATLPGSTEDQDNAGNSHFSTLNAVASGSIDQQLDLTEVGSIDRGDSAGEAHLVDDAGNRLTLEKLGWTPS